MFMRSVKSVVFLCFVFLFFILYFELYLIHTCLNDQAFELILLLSYKTGTVNVSFVMLKAKGVYLRPLLRHLRFLHPPPPPPLFTPPPFTSPSSPPLSFAPSPSLPRKILEVCTKHFERENYCKAKRNV